MPISIAAEAVNRLATAPDAAAVRSEAHRVALAFGFASVDYFFYRLPASHPAADEARPFFVTHPEAWLEDYIGERMWTSDAVHKATTARLGPVVWSALDERAMTRRERDTLHSTDSYGLRDGMSITVRGPRDGEAGVAFAYGDGRRIDRLWAESLRPAFIIVAHAIHERMVTLLGFDDENEPSRLTRLTPRERDVATWIALGKTSAEVAIILGMSADHVRRHTTRMREKFNCATTAQLVCRLTALRLIHP